MIVIRRDDLAVPSMHELLNEVHDRWFDLNQLEFNKDDGRLTIHFGDSRRGPFFRELVFEGVDQYEVADQARIQIYDICDVSVDAGQRRVVLTSGFPLRINLDMKADWKITCGQTLVPK